MTTKDVQQPLSPAQVSPPPQDLDDAMPLKRGSVPKYVPQFFVYVYSIVVGRNFCVVSFLMSIMVDIF